MQRFIEMLKAFLRVVLNVEPERARIPPPSRSSFRYKRYEDEVGFDLAEFLDGAPPKAERHSGASAAPEPSSLDPGEDEEEFDDAEDEPRGRLSDGARFVAKRSVFNASERALFEDLRAMVGDRAWVLAMVRMEDVLIPARNQPREIRYAARGRVKSRHFDFVLIDAHGSPLVVIELDGPHHRRASVRAVDEFKDAACAMAGLRLIRVPLGYRVARLAHVLNDALNSARR